MSPHLRQGIFTAFVVRRVLANVCTSGSKTVGVYATATDRAEKTTITVCTCSVKFTQIEVIG